MDFPVKNRLPEKVLTNESSDMRCRSRRNEGWRVRVDTIKRMINGVGSAAMLIAMTKTISDEQDIKQYLTDAGYKYAVTELGGNTVKGDFQGRATKALIGAVLNTHLVEKPPMNCMRFCMRRWTPAWAVCSMFPARPICR